MSRFYTVQLLHINQVLPLEERVFHHWVTVLRARLHDEAILFNGLGGEYRVQLVDIQKKSAHIKVLAYDSINRTSQHAVTLGQVMSKGDRMDYVVQKATELGVQAIQLLISERCEMRLKYARDQKKIEHWQQVAIAACEQCGLNIIPKILPPLELFEWFTSLSGQSKHGLKLVLALNAEAFTPVLNEPTHVALLVGPEGGLTSAELTEATCAGFKAWQLGPRVLRTETTPIVALSQLTLC